MVIYTMCNLTMGGNISFNNIIFLFCFVLFSKTPCESETPCLLLCTRYCVSNETKALQLFSSLEMVANNSPTCIYPIVYIQLQN